MTERKALQSFKKKARVESSSVLLTKSNWSTKYHIEVQLIPFSRLLTCDVSCPCASCLCVSCASYLYASFHCGPPHALPPHAHPHGHAPQHPQHVSRSRRRSPSPPGSSELAVVFSQPAWLPCCSSLVPKQYLSLILHFCNCWWAFIWDSILLSKDLEKQILQTCKSHLIWSEMHF